MATFGRFSGRGGGGTSAYDVMSLAKMKGAEARAVEDWNVYEKALRKYQKNMGGIKNVVDLGQLFYSFLNPVEGIGEAVGQTAISGGGANIVEGLLKNIFNVGKAPEFESTAGSDPYSVKAFDPYVRKAEGISEGIQSQLSDRFANLFTTPGMYAASGIDDLKKALQDAFKPKQSL